MSESDIDWNDESAESEKLTENDSQNISRKEVQMDVICSITEDPSNTDSDFDQNDNTSLL